MKEQKLQHFIITIDRQPICVIHSNSFPNQAQLENIISNQCCNDFTYLGNNYDQEFYRYNLTNTIHVFQIYKVHDFTRYMVNGK